MAVDKSLISGSTTLLILSLLEEKDMYGYEMIDTLKGKSNNVFELKAGTLYPLLHSMEEKGWLTVYEPVSYTHLDVYKRQPQFCARNTRILYSIGVK